jgi:prepilin peptidase CpaA
MLERLAPATQIVLALIVLIAGYYDIRWRRIPNWLTLPSLVIGLALNYFLYGTGTLSTPGLASAFIGVLLAMLLNFPLYLLHARGAGDVKLLAALGALIGWRDWLAVFILSGIIGGILAVVLMLAKGRFRKTLWNTGYLISELAHFRAPHLQYEELDVNNPIAFRLPQGAVIALGCCMFLGYHALLPK